MKNVIFWDVALCRSCDSVCSHLPTLVLRSRILLHWRWRRYVPPKRRSTQDLHSATFFMQSMCSDAMLRIYLAGYIKSFHPDFLVSLSLVPKAGRPLYSSGPRGTRWRSWLRYYVTSRKVAGSNPDEVIEFFIDLILPAALWPWGRLSL
jgi:hypothetical protein